MTQADKTDEQLHSQQYAHNPNTTNQNTSNLKHEKLILRFKTKETLSVHAPCVTGSKGLYQLSNKERKVVGYKIKVNKSSY